MTAGRWTAPTAGKETEAIPAQVKLARQLYDGKQQTVQQIADMFGVTRPTIYAYLERQRAA